MGFEKDEMIRKEEAQEAAARAKGRICAMCSATVPFDDPEPASKHMLCSHCRHQMAKDD